MLTPSQIALIFDLDNTLIHTPIDFLAVRHQLIDLLEHSAAGAAPREELVRLSLPELVEIGRQASAPLAARMWEVIGQAERHGLAQATLVDHAPEVLAALRARGHELVLLTNNARAGVDIRLAALGLSQYFALIVTRDDVPGLKPLPDGIFLVLSRLAGVQRAYMIGDAWIDGRAAMAAGVRFIGFGEKQAAALDRGIRPWAWITDLRELLTLKLGD